MTFYVVNSLIPRVGLAGIILTSVFGWLCFFSLMMRVDLHGEWENELFDLCDKHSFCLSFLSHVCWKLYFAGLSSSFAEGWLLTSIAFAPASISYPRHFWCDSLGPLSSTSLRALHADASPAFSFLVTMGLWKARLRSPSSHVVRASQGCLYTHVVRFLCFTGCRNFYPGLPVLACFCSVHSGGGNRAYELRLLHFEMCLFFPDVTISISIRTTATRILRRLC